MTASRRSALAGLAALALLAACHTPAAVPVRSAFDTSRAPAPVSDVAHTTAVELARAALLDDEEGTRRALHRLERLDTILRVSDESSTGLVPVGTDLRNTTLDDRRAYRQASQELLERDDLQPALRKRLEAFRDDAPLELAADRIRDALLIDFALAFNTVAEPLGRSIMSWEMAPYRVGRALLYYALEMYQREALSLQRRQALAHWKEFIARNPRAPEVEDLEPRVREAQNRWHRLHRDRSLEVAEKALDSGRVRLALVYADRALRHVPEDAAASELRDEAGAELLALRERQRTSLRPADEDLSRVLPHEQRGLAVALLRPDGDVAAAAARLEQADPDGALADEARFARAVALGEAGDTDAMWRALAELSERDPEESNMARHAAALVGNPLENTWETFRQARGRDHWSRARWLLFGPFYNGPRERGLGGLEWILDAPSIAESMVGTPFRLINAPWAEALPTARLVALAARRHLKRYPQDPHAESVRDWLVGYEKQRGNWIAVLDLEEDRPGADLRELAHTRERAAMQYLDAAMRERNVGLRMGMYRRIGAIYPGSRAARVAADLARTESEEVTAQRITFTREFITDNPELAGPSGLALRPALLDGESTNGELHPAGVTLLGGRHVEIAYLAPSGDVDDPPAPVREEISAEHLARIVSQVEETSYRRQLLDPLYDVKPDAVRDLYFERARLGLADDVDDRPTSISTYRYEGLSDRYGMVRARESILPFDIVVQGNVHSLSLGAFPRIRPPRETPDAVLYR